MGQIDIISASAGSGKTHQLAEELKKAIAVGAARPDSIVAMTFTVKAAEELRHRARTHLIRGRHTVEAQRLTAARIGTVHAVCAGIVEEFAFDLGLPPQLGVLDEQAAQGALRSALSSVISPGLEEELSDLTSRLDVYRGPHAGRVGGWDWQAEVERVIELIRANDIPPAQLPECARRSRDEVVRLLDDPVADGNPLETDLRDALSAFLDAPEVNDDTTKATAELRWRARAALRRLRHGRPISWDEWARFATKSSGAKSRDAMHVVHQAAARHAVHPMLRKDVCRAIEVVFDLAERGLDRYQQHKRERGVLDFTDQEAVALRLLDRPEVQDRLRHRVDLVLVDEFQDTSPIQLAIFLRLADIAPRSIWVGDQKQAIYAFRGTDPALMDAVIEQILDGNEPHTLLQSWRSRPGLVKLTSDLFAPPFAQRGIPEQRVRLSPALEKEPEGLGPIAECWKLETRKVEEDAAALAGTVRDLLADESVHIRDSLTNEARVVRPEDVAVLCRRNRTSQLVATELEALDVPTRLVRPGLLGTLEARVIMAGLALWIDRRDALAAAELARMVAYPDDGNGWINELVERPGQGAFADVPVVERILEARSKELLAGGVEVVDRVVKLAEIPDLCRRWGDAASRLANVEAFRRLAIEYADRCVAEGLGCTPSGLFRHLEDLVEREADQRGLARDLPAVTVSTWHGAKGLEWPITVLYELDEQDADLAAIGVHVECDRERINLAAPLADRWVRYWPYPLGYPRKNLPFRTRLAAHPVTAKAMERSDREEMRLLYVGWTRARDRVVLAARPGRICTGTVGRLQVADGTISEPADGASRVNWAGVVVGVQVRRGAMAELVEHEPTADHAYPIGEPRTYPPAYLAPSGLKAPGTAGEPERIGPRIVVTGSPQWAHVGNAVHGFLAADRPELEHEVRRRIAHRLLEAWEVPEAIEIDELLAASDRLREWVGRQWPDATWHRELPVMGRQADGSIIRGEVDLVLETDEGIIIVDHKSFPGSSDQAVEQARGYSGQLMAYAGTMSDVQRRPVLGSFIHMPVSGLVIPIASGTADRM